MAPACGKTRYPRTFRAPVHVTLPSFRPCCPSVPSALINHETGKQRPFGLSTQDEGRYRYWCSQLQHCAALRTSRACWVLFDWETRGFALQHTLVKIPPVYIVDWPRLLCCIRSSPLISVSCRFVVFEILDKSQRTSSMLRRNSGAPLGALLCVSITK
jgi:hypothetical protein